MLAHAWEIVKRAIAEFLDDDAMSWAAAVAFYAALSFAPLIVILITVGSWLGADTQAGMVAEIKALVGEQAGRTVEQVIVSARESESSGVLAFTLSLAVALFSASGVFAQLQLALNRIWEVDAAAQDAGVGAWLRKRLLSMGMVAGIAFLLLVSLIASAAIGYLVPRGESWARAGSMLASLVVYVPLFMLIFKVLPDVSIAWRDVLFGAVITAALFLLGKELIGLYLGHSAVGSAYGAAGSLIVLLVWVYYSSIILLFGAEITQARAREAGRALTRDPGEATGRVAPA